LPDSERDYWKAWLDEYGPKLLLFARQFVPSAADAEEIVQEAFVRFWRSGRYKSSNPKAALFGYVRWAALDWLRRQKRYERADSLAPPASVVDGAMFTGELEREEFRAAAEEAIRKLPADQREVLVLKIWGGLSYPEIGEALDISPNTAASRFRYAVSALRKELGESKR